MNVKLKKWTFDKVITYMYIGMAILGAAVIGLSSYLLLRDDRG